MRYLLLSLIAACLCSQAMPKVPLTANVRQSIKLYGKVQVVDALPTLLYNGFPRLRISKSRQWTPSPTTAENGNGWTAYRILPFNSWMRFPILPLNL